MAQERTAVIVGDASQIKLLGVPSYKKASHERIGSIIADLTMRLMTEWKCSDRIVNMTTRVLDLGVTLDQELTLAPHINSLCRACYYQLRQLRTVSRSLTSTAAANLVHSIVTSRLDYCSSLYIGLPATRLNCLNHVLRSAARLIGRLSKFVHISAYMRDVLHWLPLRQRIEFRVAVLV